MLTSSEYEPSRNRPGSSNRISLPPSSLNSRALDPSQRDEAFLRGWTRKEAILKATGVGLAGLATAFETMFGTITAFRRFTPAAPLSRVGEWSLWEAAAGDHYVAALAVAVAGPSRACGISRPVREPGCNSRCVVRTSRRRLGTHHLGSGQVPECRATMEVIVLGLIVLFIYAFIRLMASLSAWMTGKRYRAYRQVADRFGGRYESRGSAIRRRSASCIMEPPSASAWRRRFRASRPTPAPALSRDSAQGIPFRLELAPAARPAPIQAPKGTRPVKTGDLEFRPRLRGSGQ